MATVVYNKICLRNFWESVMPKAKKKTPGRKPGRPKMTRTDNPWSPRYRTVYRCQTVESVAEALRRYKGNISAVARSHGVSDPATREFIQNHSDILEPILQEARRRVIDHAEWNLFDAAEKGNMAAVSKVLDCLARDRGYGRQLALTGPIEAGGTAGPVQIQIVLPENFRQRKADGDRPQLPAIIDDPADESTILFHPDQSRVG